MKEIAICVSLAIGLVIVLVAVGLRQPEDSTPPPADEEVDVERRKFILDLK